MSILSLAFAVFLAAETDYQLVAAEEYVRQESALRQSAVAKAESDLATARRRKAKKTDIINLEATVEAARNSRPVPRIGSQWAKGRVGTLPTHRHVVTSIDDDKRGGTVSGWLSYANKPAERATVRIQNVDAKEWKVGRETELSQPFVVTDLETKVVNGEVVQDRLILVVEPIDQKAIELARKNAERQP